MANATPVTVDGAPSPADVTAAAPDLAVLDAPVAPVVAAGVAEVASNAAPGAAPPVTVVVTSSGAGMGIIQH